MKCCGYGRRSAGALQPYRLAAFGLTLFAALPAWGQANEPADVVADVRVEGLQRVEPEAVLGRVETKVGAPLDPVVLTADLRRVWETGFFRDVRIEEERVPGGWRVVFVVVEKPSIREVILAGNHELSEEDVKAVVDVKPFTILNVEELKRNVQKIKDLYVEKGFYLAAVEYRIEPVPGNDQEVNVTFDIQENAKVVVRQITFIGNRALTDEQIASALQTREGSELSFLTQAGTYKEEFFETDIFRIQALYFDHGYITAKVGSRTATISPDRRFIDLAVTIEEGEQYQIGEIRFSGQVQLADEKGKPVIEEQALRNKLSVAKGETFNRTELFQDINAVTDVYRDQGYAYANVTPNSVPHPDTRTVDLDLEVERGEIVYFGRIEVTGNTKTRDKVVRREMRIYEGEKYTASGLNQSRARVYQLGYFETVNVTTNRGAKPELMDVVVEIKEKSTGTFQVGAGFSSVESFIATAQIAQNNWLGNGQLLSVSAQLSFGDFARQLATLQFYEPYLLDTEWALGVNAYITQRYYREFQRNATGIAPSLGYPLTPDLRVTAGYTVEWLQIETGTGGPLLADLTRGNGLNSSFNSSIAYDTRDNRLFPTSGSYHMLSGDFAVPFLGADEDLQYGRLQLFMRYYQPLPWLSMVLKLNASLGYVFSYNSQRVAVSERFFPGGIYSVRGFEPRGLGPRERVAFLNAPNASTSSFVIGGNKEAVFNLELEFPIIEAAGIRGVVFADAGNAYDDDEGFFYAGVPSDRIPPAFLFGSNRRISPPLGLFWSFGWGFRWFSPIGPLRFEWGVPITKTDENSREIIFEFTIGNFF